MNDLRFCVRVSRVARVACKRGAPETMKQETRTNFFTPAASAASAQYFTPCSRQHEIGDANAKSM
jgi:hypothetical protein